MDCSVCKAHRVSLARAPCLANERHVKHLGKQAEESGNRMRYTSCAGNGCKAKNFFSKDKQNNGLQRLVMTTVWTEVSSK